MNIGTRSILYGGHQFLIHPLLLARAWTKLYGFPWDPRLWVAFLVHDLGYWGKPNMDGPEGETHPELGARIMTFLFGEAWGLFTIAHSRFYARKNDLPITKLCVADKLATVITPNWLYLRLIRATGEIEEYRKPPDTRYEYTWSEKSMMTGTDEEWVLALKSYMGGQVPKLDKVAISMAALKEQLGQTAGRGSVIALTEQEPCNAENSVDKNRILP